VYSLTKINQLKELLQKIKPVSSEDYLKTGGEDLPVDEEGGLLIVPDAGFVFKTKEANTETKFFINIAHHPILEKPEAQEIVDMENQQGVRIPMSLGNIREDFDNRKEPCKVLDCIINPDVCKEMQKKTDNELIAFFADILCAYIIQKHKVELSAKGRPYP